ncbi:MAG: thiamine phosphate synthase [Gammaproteobacteria bacterium]|nr:thiamine phosphate synthase [Gammaproteobacteria bacterium]
MARIHGLYAVTPDSDQPQRLLQQVAAALAGGARVLQYRDKINEPAVRLDTARQIRALCDATGATFIINDDVQLALACGADGVHVGKDDLALEQARVALPDKIIGVSCYNQLQRAQDMAARGADYVAFGRFFPSKTKPNAAQAELELLRRARVELSLPIVAIGGVTIDNAAQLLAAGADSVAVIDDLFSAADIEARASAYAALFA